MKVDTHTVDGKKFDIEFSAGTGKFSVLESGEVIAQAESLEAVKKKLVASQRRKSVRIALPAVYPITTGTRWNSRDDEVTELEDVTVTGVHQRNRTVLLKRANGKADTTDCRTGDLLKPLTPKERTEYLAAAKLSRESRKAFEKLVERYSYGKKEIETAYSKAETAAGIEEDDD